TGVSFDGGRSWTLSQAALSRCGGGNAGNGGDYARSSDPWVTIGADGTAYQSSISFTGAIMAAGSVSAILVARSTDGGLTWNNPVTIQRDGSNAFNDKEAITADAGDARYAYVTWDRLDSNSHGATWIARTSNGGASWEPAHPIYDPGPNNQTLNNQI